MRTLVTILTEARSLFAAARDGDEREHAAGMLLSAETIAGHASPDEVRKALIEHARHSSFFPKPNELLAIVRANRPERNEAEQVSTNEARTRADNQRLAAEGSKVRWYRDQHGKETMFTLGSPGEMRGCTQTGRVIAPWFKAGPEGTPGEWFVNRDDARSLADCYAEHGARFVMKGNVVTAVDEQGMPHEPVAAAPVYAPRKRPVETGDVYGDIRAAMAAKPTRTRMEWTPDDTRMMSPRGPA